MFILCSVSVNARTDTSMILHKWGTDCIECIECIEGGHHDHWRWNGLALEMIEIFMSKFSENHGKDLDVFPKISLAEAYTFLKVNDEMKIGNSLFDEALANSLRWHKVAYTSSGIWHDVSVRNLSNLPWQEGSKIVPDIMEKARNGVGTKWGE